MGKELAKAYEPHEVEERIYEFWMNGKYFPFRVSVIRRMIYSVENWAIRYGRNMALTKNGVQIRSARLGRMRGRASINSVHHRQKAES